MKGELLLGMALGAMIGAVGVGLCKPAQKFVQNSAENLKEEATKLIKAKKE